MTSPCGCRVEYRQYAQRPRNPPELSDYIVYCPLHQAAEEMLAALKRLMETACSGWCDDNPKAEERHVESWDQAEALIARAEGKGT